MKATKFFALVAALLAVGCTNDNFNSIDPNDTPEGGTQGQILTLYGQASDDAEGQARIAVGQDTADGTTKHKVFWRNNDAVGIYSLDGTTINNVKAAETNIESGSQATATFQTANPVEVAHGEELYIYYPHNNATTLSGSVVSTTLSNVQAQTNRTVADHIGPYTFAYDIAEVGNDGAVNFQMQHPLAYVQVRVNTTEFKNTHALKSIELVDRTGVAALSGDYKVDLTKPASEAIVEKSNTSSSVKLNITSYTNNNFSDGATRTFWFVTLPADFTNGSVWLLLELENLTTKDVTYVPVRYDGVKLPAGSMNIIKLQSLGEANNSAKNWYTSTDNRLMPQLGYAYGEQNTYLIQCKNGSTYPNATYTPDANIPDEVRIDIRGRGDFHKIVDVTKATFEWAKNMKGVIYTMEATNYSHIDPTAYEIDTTEQASGFIKVKNVGAYAGSPILMMKVDGKVVWSWSFWNIAADGTTFGDVTIGGYTFANMPIGQASTQYSTWSANNRKGNNYKDFMGRTVHTYQWGRPTPQFWSEDCGGATHGRQIVEEKSPTVEEALSHPETYYLSDNDYLFDGGAKRDLWGDKDAKGASANAGCIKSVYDPCPKGYRVADWEAINAFVTSNPAPTYDQTRYEVGQIWNTDNGGTHKFLNTGFMRGAFNSERTKLDVYGWSYTGTASNTKYNTAWANAMGLTTSYALYISEATTPKISQNKGDFSVSVRCQKDADNR